MHFIFVFVFVIVIVFMLVFVFVFMFVLGGFCIETNKSYQLSNLQRHFVAEEKQAVGMWHAGTSKQ